MIVSTRFFGSALSGVMVSNGDAERTRARGSNGVVGKGDFDEDETAAAASML